MCGCGTVDILVEYLYCFLLVDRDLYFFVTCCVGGGQVRKEAEMMLAIAIEERNKEALSAAVALANQLRLRTPQVLSFNTIPHSYIYNIHTVG